MCKRHRSSLKHSQKLDRGARSHKNRDIVCHCKYILRSTRTRLLPVGDTALGRPARHKHVSVGPDQSGHSALIQTGDDGPEGEAV